MKIKLSDIHPSPQPVRTTWDEDKLNELAQSIKEQGLIVPIKVRPNGLKPCRYGRSIDHGYDALTDAGPHHGDDNYDASELCHGCAELMAEVYGPDWSEFDDKPAPLHPPFEIVYGYRRVEAAKRAGLGEVESIIEGIDDRAALIQALIENIQREDMNDADLRDSLRHLKSMSGQTWEQIARIFGWTRRRILQLSGIYDDEMEYIRGETGFTERHTRLARSAGELKTAVLDKAVEEGLHSNQIKAIAKSVAATQDPRRREMLLETPYSSFIHDPDMNRERAKRYGASDPDSHSKEPSAGAMFEMTIEVKMLLDYFKSSRKMAQEAIKMDEIGKFSPEARLFVARKAQAMVEAWQGVVDRLEADS